MGRAYTQEQGINGLPADRRITQVRPQRAGAGSSACSPNNYRKDGQYSESSGFEIKPDEQTKRPHWMRGSSTVLPLLSERSFLSMPISHMAYSDESCWNRGRYRSIGMVSAEADCAGELKAELAEILAASDVSEFKWSKLKTAKYRFAAEKMIRVALSQADAGRLRVDVIIWDVEDDRHRLPVLVQREMDKWGSGFSV